MKKIIAIFMASLMALSLVGCTRLGYEKEGKNAADTAKNLFAIITGNEEISLPDEEEPEEAEEDEYTPSAPIDFDEYLEKYKNTGVNQLVFIKYYDEGSNAEAYYYTKDNTTRDKWKLEFTCDADIAPNGIDKKKEGDQRTPTGDYGLVRAVGYKENPGCALEYTMLDDQSVICNDDPETYNTIVNCLEVEHFCEGTKLYNQKSTYNYALDIDFNADCKFLGGSGIFLRCKSSTKDSTGGAVAIAEEDLLKIVTTVTPGARIIIGREAR